MRDLDVDENLEKSNRMICSMAPSLTFLLIEIMIDILSRLPVKSLIQLSSVCKSWFKREETRYKHGKTIKKQRPKLR